MLSWCSYCQRFLGEVPPYDRFVVSHGICAACEPNVFTLSESEFAHALLLKGIQVKLFEAGQRNDLEAARQVIEDLDKANVRVVDILMGLVAPMLYQIGEDWSRGLATVAQEHRLTAFCEKLFELVAAKVSAKVTRDAASLDHPDVLLMNAPGNYHTIAIRIIALSLADAGVLARVVDKPLSVEDLVLIVLHIQPHNLLISMTLPEQTPDVAKVAEQISAFPNHSRPKIIVGGYAVKQGLIPPIPGVELIADIGELVKLKRERLGTSEMSQANSAF